MFASPGGFANIYEVACCLLPDTVVCMRLLTAVAYIVMDSHVEMDKSGRSVHTTMWCVHNIQRPLCCSKKYASYAVCVRICAMVMGGKAVSTNLVWAAGARV